jgi:hypothetical protein
MTPTLIHLRANTITPQLPNSGELLLYVLHGAIAIHPRHYTPARLNTGDSLYVDSEMLLHLTLPPHTPETQLLSIHTTRSR